MNVESVTVGGTQYNIAQASAVDQKKLLHLMAARMTYAVGSDTDVDLDTTFIFGSLMALSEADFDVVAKLVLYKTAVNGSDSVVDIADFQGRITEYYQLVAEAVKANLADFIGWLESARQPKAAATAGEKVE